MFEDSLVESTGRIRTRTSRFAVGSFLLQAALIAVLVLIPFLYPASLPKQALTTLLIAPPPPPAPAIVAVHAAAPRNEAPVLNSLTLPSRIPPRAVMSAKGEPEPGPVEAEFESMGSSTPGNLQNFFSTAIGPAPKVVSEAKSKSGPIRVSAGVAAGLLLTPMQPVYPVIAKAARVQGTVVVDATISKTGAVINAHAVSGPPMLAQAAIQAIARARYQPFKLNGEPVDVDTTINVIFSLNSE